MAQDFINHSFSRTTFMTNTGGWFLMIEINPTLIYLHDIGNCLDVVESNSTLDCVLWRMSDHYYALKIETSAK